jgi:hypothetical protein
MASVFLSYRRSDTGGYAGRLADALAERFGRENVFMDVDSIAPGADFTAQIRTALDRAALTLVLIGPNWAGERINEPTDVVRQEVAAALARDVTAVVPVLVEGATMPAAATLPADVAAIARINAMPLSNTRWQYDVGRIASLIDARGPQSAARRAVRTLLPRQRRLPAAIGVIAVLAVIAVIVAVTSGGGSKVDPAKKVAACEASHAMTKAAVERPPRPGESAITAGELQDSAPGFDSFATCTWPPAAGADADGYRVIVNTSVINPDGHSEAVGDTNIDRIESACALLSLTYSFGIQGAVQALPAFQAQPQEVWQYNPANDASHAFALGDPLAPRSIFPKPNETQVIHSDTVVLSKATCVR